MAILVADIFSTLGIDTTKFQSDIHASKEVMSILRMEINRLKDDVKSGAISLDTYANQMNMVNQATDTLRQSMQGLEGANRSWGRATLLVSQGLEDLQYGFSAVLNNIPGVVMALGGTAGLAGAISIVGVAATVAYRNWDKISHLWGNITTHTLAQDMKELAKVTEKTADETLRLAQYEERRQAGDKALTSKSKEEKERQEVVSNALGELGAEGKQKFINAMAKDIKKQGTVVYTADEQNRLAVAKEQEQGRPGDFEHKLAGINAVWQGQEAEFTEGLKNKGTTDRMEIEKKALDRQAKQFFDNMASMYETPEKMMAQIKKLKDLGGFETLVDELEHFMETGVSLSEDIAKDQKKNEELTKKTKEKAETDRKQAETKAASDTKQAEAKSQQILQSDTERHAQSMLGTVIRGELPGVGAEGVRAQLEKTTGQKPSDELVKGTMSALNDKIEKAIEARMNAHPKESREDAMKALHDEEMFDRERKDQQRDRAMLPEAREEEAERKKLVRQQTGQLKAGYGKAAQRAMRQHQAKGMGFDESGASIREQLMDRLEEAGVADDVDEESIDNFIHEMKIKQSNENAARGMKGGGKKAPVTTGARTLIGAKNPHRARDAMKKSVDEAAESAEQRRADKLVTPSADDQVVTLLKSIDEKIGSSDKSLARITREGMASRMA